MPGPARRCRSDCRGCDARRAKSTCEASSTETRHAARASRLHSRSVAWRAIRPSTDECSGRILSAPGSAAASAASSAAAVSSTIARSIGSGVPSTVPRDRSCCARCRESGCGSSGRASQPASPIDSRPVKLAFCCVVSAKSCVERPRWTSASCDEPSKTAPCRNIANHERAALEQRHQLRIDTLVSRRP